MQIAKGRVILEYLPALLKQMCRISHDYLHLLAFPRKQEVDNLGWGCCPAFICHSSLHNNIK